jgi:hypothetical protein
MHPMRARGQKASIVDRLCWPALVSIVVAVVLILIASLRFASYFRSSQLGELIGTSAFQFVAYRPSVYLNVQFFKLLATPSVVAGQYLLFRLLNRGHNDPRRYLDFESPWLRLVLTSIVTLNWILIESAKFSNSETFYPYSQLESQSMNICVLLVSQLLAFVGMKYFCFSPLLSPAEGDSAVGHEEAG